MFTPEITAQLLIPNCGMYALRFEANNPSPATLPEDATPLPLTLQKASPKRKIEFLAGRFAAQQAILSVGGPLHALVGIADDRSPIWPAGYVGSITHTANFASAIAANARHYRSIGYDAEAPLTHDIASEIYTEVTHPSELALLKSFSFITAVALIFSSKESVFKALAPLVKTFFGFDCFCLIQHEPENRRLRFRLHADLSLEYRKGFEIDTYYFINDLIHTVTFVREDQ